MTHFVAIFNDHSLSCKIYDKRTLKEFLGYLTTKIKYPVFIVKVVVREGATTPLSN
jgi:hypothetical protein